jgi:murein DD-endopeptidase MepM/ murein hydrolase activator NlpD
MSKLIRRTAALLVGVALAFGILVGFQLPADAASCQSKTYRSTFVRVGHRGPAAKAVQCLLRKVGYRLSADGSFSRSDAAKVKDFQRKNRIITTGNVGKLTWPALIRAAKRGNGGSTPSSSDRACMPVDAQRIAARFGATGSWARYHTGIDFSARSGSIVRAPRAGVVTFAGTGGRAGGWAGRYVAIRHSDGTSSLYAHLSSSSVRAGQRVSACATVGRVGATGRAFAPHLHFEIYPAGVTPGDVYRAVNPAPWLARLGLRV